MSLPTIYEPKSPQVLIVEDDELVRVALEAHVNRINRHLGYESEPIITPQPSPAEATIDLLTAMEDENPIAVVLVNFHQAVIEDMRLLETSREWHPYATHIVLYETKILEHAVEEDDGTVIRPAQLQRQYETFAQLYPEKMARLGTPQEYWLNSEEPKEGDERTLADWVLDRSKFSLTYGPVLIRAFEFFEFRYENWIGEEERRRRTIVRPNLGPNVRPASDAAYGPRKIDTPVEQSMRPDAPAGPPDFFIRIKEE